MAELFKKYMKALIVPFLVSVTAIPAFTNPCQDIIKESALRKDIWQTYLEMYSSDLEDWKNGNTSKNDFCTMMSGFVAIGTEQLKYQEQLKSCICDEFPEQCAEISDFVLKNRERLASIALLENSECSK